MEENWELHNKDQDLYYFCNKYWIWLLNSETEMDYIDQNMEGMF